MRVFDSSNEESGCTYYNAKNLHSLQCTVAEKIKKNPKNTFFKITVFVVFHDFFINGTVLRVGVFSAFKHPHMIIFIFWDITGFYNFSDPFVPGVTHKNNFCHDFFFFLRHKTYKSTQNITLFLILEKMPPPPLE